MKNYCYPLNTDQSLPAPQEVELEFRQTRSNSPTVSIFMPVYNSEKYLAQTLDSLLAQTFQDFEIIIADDGSTDQSLAIAQSYVNRDRRIKVLALPHEGEVKARNQAIRHTHPGSKYLMNHDSDDVSLPTKLERLVEYLDAHPEIAIVGCFAEYFDDQGKPLGQPAIEWQPERIRRTFGEVNSMINSAALIRREVFNTIGAYREEFRGTDDYDFFARALLAGFELANIPEGLHKIRLHPASVCSTRGAILRKLEVRIRKNYKRHQHQSLARTGASVKRENRLAILHTVQLYSPHIGGSEIVVQQLSERLAKRGHRVTVATKRLAERDFSELNGVQLEQFGVAGSLAYSLRGPDRARYQRFLLEHPADVMMNYAAEQWATDLAFEVVQRTAKLRVNIIAPCGYFLLTDSQKRRWSKLHRYHKKVLPKFLPLYDAAVYHSAQYQDFEYGQALGLQNGVIIPLGAAEEEFTNPVTINFREKYQITTRYLGLCVANFFKLKGQDRVIECVRAMNRTDFTMILIGKEGEQMPSLQAQAAGLNVRFLVNIPRAETVAAFHAADLFLYGSYRESGPLVIIEAKASRTPFISTDCGNVHEWQGGIVCAPQAMAFHANRLLDDEGQRQHLAEAGWREWKEKLTWEAVTDCWEELYLRLTRSCSVI
jgi:glycosyltransferase involved in cell wall biosynthesis